MTWTPGPASRPPRPFVSRLLAVLAALCLTGGLVAGLVHRELLDANRFAAHADAVRTDPDVAAALGERITERVLEAEPDLVAVRPLVAAAATELVGSRAFSGMFRLAVVPLHHALVDGVHGDVVLTLADAGAVLVAVASALSPRVAATVPADLDVELSEIGRDGVDGRFVGAARTTGVLAWLLPGIAVLLVAGAATAAPDRWPRAFARLLGAALLIAAGAGGLLAIAVGLVARSRDGSTLQGAVLAAAWKELDGPVWVAIALLAATGYLLWACAPLAGSLRPRELARAGRGWLTVEPAGARPALARPALVTVVGALLLADPLSVVRVVGTAAGVLLVLEGVVQLAEVASRTLPVLRRMVTESARAAGRWVAATAALLLLVLLAAAGAWPVDRVAASAPLGTVPAVCNGHPELCDRRYDHVSFPATHNSMSAGDAPGWFFAEQPTGVLGQLDDGIRVFLVDSWYGRETRRSDVVATAGAGRERSRRQAEADFGAAAVDSALRLQASAGLAPHGPTTPYLCHAMCELGSTPWQPLMEQVRAWLDQHPQEVVTFIVQDEVSPSDTATLVESAGLLPYVHLQHEGQPWPTLGEMIRSGKRVVFFMENHAGGTAFPWLMDVNRWVQETPYDFARQSDFSCAPNRGRPGAPLFLINHWLGGSLDRISNSARVNATEVLGTRARQCQEERGLQPTFLAVDFYDQGDLFGVVDELNGLP